MLKKNNKGFTLIEIIVCIVLVALVGTVSIILLYKNNDLDKEKEKIIDNIVSASDVYFSMNNELQKKLEDNYGYLVITIDELKEIGLLSEDVIVPEASDEEKKNGYDYNKIVIIDRDYDNKIRNLSSDSLGYIDYQYPYKKNEPFILDIPTLTIENFETNYFKCNSGLNDRGISYVDENYNVVYTDVYKCNEKDITEYNTSNLYVSEIDLDYSIEINELTLRNNRKIKINPSPNMKLTAKIIGKDLDYNCGEWTKEDIKLMVDEEKNQNKNEILHKDIKIYFNDKDDNCLNELQFDNWYNIQVNNDSAFENTIKAKYELRGVISEEVLENYPVPEKCEIKIDKIKPSIEEEIKDNKVYINFYDGESGLNGYFISKTQISAENINNIEWKPCNNTKYEIEDVDQYIYVSDKAGNINEYMYLKLDSKIPSIAISPIENSYSLLKVNIKDKKGIIKGNKLEDIQISYTFPDFESEERSKKVANNCFINDHNFEVTKYTGDACKGGEECSCNEMDCTFELDLIDLIKKITSDSSCNFNYEYMDNMKIKYTITVKNKEGYHRTLSADTTLEYEISDDFNKKIEGKSVLWGRDDTNSTIDLEFNKLNSGGDIIFLKYSRDGNSNNGTEYDSYGLYFYDNSDKTIKILPKNKTTRSVRMQPRILEFTDEKIKYSLNYLTGCSNSDNDYSICSDDYCFTHIYDIHENDYSVYEDLKDCRETDEVIVNYTKKYEDLPNYTFLSNYLDMLEKMLQRYYDNTRFYYSLENDYPYYFIEGDSFYSIIMSEKKSNTTRIEYKKIYFKTQPTIDNLSYSKGKK